MYNNKIKVINEINFIINLSVGRLDFLFTSEGLFIDIYNIKYNLIGFYKANKKDWKKFNTLLTKHKNNPMTIQEFNEFTNYIMQNKKRKNYINHTIECLEI